LLVFTSLEIWLASKPGEYQTPDIAVTSISVENAAHTKKWQSIFIETSLRVSWFNAGDSIKLDSLLKNKIGATLENCAGSLPFTTKDTRKSGSETIVKTCRFDYFKSIAPNGEYFSFSSIADKWNHIRETNEHNNSQTKSVRVGKKWAVCDNARKQLVCGKRSWLRKTFNSICELQEAGYSYDSVWQCSSRPTVTPPSYERPTFRDDYTRNPIDLSYNRRNIDTSYNRRSIDLSYNRHPAVNHYNRYSQNHYHNDYHRSDYYHSNYQRSGWHDSSYRWWSNYDNYSYNSYGLNHYDNNNSYSNNKSQYDSVNYSYNDRINYNSHSRSNHYNY